MTARPTLVITNDYPPRRGGIQSYVWELLARQPADSVVVYASTYPGAEELDARTPYRVVRHPTGLLIPTPAAHRRITALAREIGARSAWFGAAAPLALLAPSLRRAGVERVVATTHGHEIGWAMLPGARALLRRIGDTCDVVTYLGEYTRARLAPAVGPHPQLVRLSPGVDAGRFRPDVDGAAVRARFGLGGRPVVVCVSRLVPRKGQDVLIDCWPRVRAAVPDATLLLVGTGPYEPRLRRRAGAGVVFAGGVSEDELAAHVRAGDVFAMPCRTRRGGMDVEGLGIVFLEASACGLPVIAGRSGGAPETVLEGRTGYVVDGRDRTELTDRIVTLLRDEALRARMGAAGREFVLDRWQWDDSARALRDALDG